MILDVASGQRKSGKVVPVLVQNIAPNPPVLLCYWPVLPELNGKLIGAAQRVPTTGPSPTLRC